LIPAFPGSIPGAPAIKYKKGQLTRVGPSLVSNVKCNAFYLT
jgi:hypothetical protein